MNLNILLQFPYYDAFIQQKSKWIKSSAKKFTSGKSFELELGNLQLRLLVEYKKIL